MGFVAHVGIAGVWSAVAASGQIAAGERLVIAAAAAEVERNSRRVSERGVMPVIVVGRRYHALRASVAGGSGDQRYTF